MISKFPKELEMKVYASYPQDVKDFLNDAPRSEVQTYLYGGWSNNSINLFQDHLAYRTDWERPKQPTLPTGLTPGLLAFRLFWVRNVASVVFHDQKNQPAGSYMCQTYKDDYRLIGYLDGDEFKPGKLSDLPIGKLPDSNPAKWAVYRDVSEKTRNDLYSRLRSIIVELCDLGCREHVQARLAVFGGKSLKSVCPEDYPSLLSSLEHLKWHWDTFGCSPS